MHRKLTSVIMAVVLLTAGLMATGCPPPPPEEDGIQPQLPEVEVITLRAWTMGPEKVAHYRATNLMLAAERLNKMLEDVGAGVRVEVEADFWTECWASFRKRTLLAFKGGDPAVIPDIVCSSHLDTPLWAEAGWIVPLDAHRQRYWEKVYSDFFPHLWDAVAWDGRIWGVPQDIEVRMLWFRKDHLRALGWSEEEIAALPQRIAAREVLLDDIVEIAAQMEAAGLVEHGIIHRPTVGPDWFQFVVAFGGEYFDAATGKLVLEKAPILEVLEFIYRMTHVHGVTPPGMTGWPWPTIHKAFSYEGAAGFFLTGGMWHWPMWQHDFLITEEYLFENVGWALIPAGNPEGLPNQVGHPLAYMVTSASRHPDLAALLIAKASSVDLITNHSIAGAKLALRRSQVAYERFAEAKFLAAAAELLPYQRFLPPHPKTGLFSTIFFEAISAVQTGMQTPEVALETMIRRVQAEIGEEIIVR